MADEVARAMQCEEATGLGQGTGTGFCLHHAWPGVMGGERRWQEEQDSKQRGGP